jgi:hypothetical protein
MKMRMEIGRNTSGKEEDEERVGWTGQGDSLRW